MVGAGFRVRGDLLFLTREVAKAYLRGTLEERDGDDTHGDGGWGDNKGKRGDRGGEKEEDTRGGGCREEGCALATPRHARGVASVSRLAKGGEGGSGANLVSRVNRANPPPRDPASARCVIFQVTYAVGG